MNPLIIIPARYASIRFPGKPLALIDGKSMIQLVFERCKTALEQVFVATDDERIASAVSSFGGEYLLTSENHQSGTERCAEAASKLSSKYNFDLVIKVQGDEPFIEKMQLLEIANCFNDPLTEIATLITPITSSEIFFDQNKVKVVKSINGFAHYFSRQPIPFQRDVDQDIWFQRHTYFLHLGMYAYKPEVLQTISKQEPTPLEKSEKLEQLRWLENGYRIKTSETEHTNFGIDTPADLDNLTKRKI
jgi:3-deoxy-manno-octulosonate cytidylyltransferase (CMP-KDO synthetase)